MKSSTSFFSYLVSDMNISLNTLPPTDFMDPHCLGQMADDTAVAGESTSSIRNEYSCIHQFSKEIYQSINTDKT